MKEKIHINLLMLGMMILIPGICFARDYRDSILMNRVWSYHTFIEKDFKDLNDNVYMVYTINCKRRNVFLWMVPTMYSVAHGDKAFIGEAYGKLHYKGPYKHYFSRQVKIGTIPHHRRPLPALFDLMAPNVYGEQLYDDRLLSPFHRSNRRYYKYGMHYGENGRAVVTFKPRIRNTQLVDGRAVIDFKTGRIDSISYKGDYDMLKFSTVKAMNAESAHGLTLNSHTNAQFKFLFNNIQAELTSIYHLPHTLPDSIIEQVNPALMDSLRPIPLTKEQDSIYIRFHDRNVIIEQEKEEEDSIRKPSFTQRFMDFIWYDVGNYLANSNSLNSGRTYMSISPLLNPFYMSYSSSRGLSYKLTTFFRYKWNDHRYLTIEPNFGYVTKLKRFYYTVPVNMYYNPKRLGFVSIVWGNGNHISNGALADTFKKRIGVDSISLPEYRDEYVNIYNNIGIFDWIHLTTGINYHLRSATSFPELIEKAGLNSKYRSFAPYFTIHLMPWQDRGPMLTVNYERSIMNVLRSNLQYARWEFDASYKHNVKRMQILNMRLGAGFYTNRSTDYFVDFSNFYDNNLPTGWDDDWTGQFQLVDSRWYNESNYYIRSNLSYDSPLLALSWTPWIGRFIETERLYFSALAIEHTRPYFELGYGFKCRYFSTGIFASFLNTNYNKFELKFTFELFRRW